MEKIGNIRSVELVQSRIPKANSTNKSAKGDSVSISREAFDKYERLQAVETVKSSAPDVRADRVAEIKAKINDPNYINDEIISKTADNIMNMLFPGDDRN